MKYVRMIRIIFILIFLVFGNQAFSQFEQNNKWSIELNGGGTNAVKPYAPMYFSNTVGLFHTLRWNLDNILTTNMVLNWMEDMTISKTMNLVPMDLAKNSEPTTTEVPSADS